MSGLGLIVGMVIYIVVGWAWYSKALFGKLSQRLSKNKGIKMEGREWSGIIINAFLFSLGMCYVSSILRVGTFWSGISLGLMMGIFFVAPVMINGFLWSKRPIKLFWLHLFEYLIVLALIGGFLTLF